MNKAAFILLFMMCCMAVRAQDNDYNADTVVSIIETKEQDYEEPTIFIDTSLAIRSVNISEDTIKKFRGEKAFAYIHNLDSLLKASQKKEPEMRAVNNSGSFMSRLLGGAAIKVILWILAILFVGIIVYQLLVSKGIFQKASRSKVSEQAVEEDELLLHNDFDLLVQQAYRSGDYRMAVRYLFLKTLQQLRDKGQITYEPDKTNSRYVFELPVNWRNDFSQLILQYEYVWYGHFDINAGQYEQVQQKFSSFLQKV